MRRIVVVDHVTLDGVMQAPGRPDRRGGFAHGGWAMPRNNAVMSAELGKGVGQAELLFGATYQPDPTAARGA